MWRNYRVPVNHDKLSFYSIIKFKSRNEITSSLARISTKHYFKLLEGMKHNQTKKGRNKQTDIQLNKQTKQY